MIRELNLLRKQLLAPYKKYLLSDADGAHLQVDYDSFHKDKEGHLLFEKASLFAALRTAAAIARTIEELQNEAATIKNKEVATNSTKP